MPQPLHQKYAAKVTIQRAAATRQEQALNAANVISQWAKLDSIMPIIFNGLIKSDPTPAAATFAAIRNFQTRQDAIRKQAEIGLKDQRDKGILNAILKIYSSTAKSRDKIAHHLWGTHDDFPDAIILVDPTTLRDISTATQAHKVNDDFTFDDAVKYQEDMRQAMMVWRTKDFADVAGRADRGFVLATMFSIMISKVGPHAPDDPTRQMLLAQREISEFLNRPGNGSKKSQAT